MADELRAPLTAEQVAEIAQTIRMNTDDVWYADTEVFIDRLVASHTLLVQRLASVDRVRVAYAQAAHEFEDIATVAALENEHLRAEVARLQSTICTLEDAIHD